MTQRIESAVSRRRRVIAALADRLVRQENPRLAMSAVLLGAVIAAFLTTAALLSLGIETMAIRYAIATCVGYAAFLVGIKIWLARKLRRSYEGRSGWMDVLDLGAEPPTSGTPQASFAFGGDSGYGGGGGGSSFDSVAIVAPKVEASDGDSFGIGDIGDLDDGAIVLVPVMIAGIIIVGLVGSFAILVAAPALLGEALLDGLIAGWAYRHLRHHSRQHWLNGVVRQSWTPFAIILVTFVVGGLAVQLSSPAVRSIGDLWR